MNKGSYKGCLGYIGDDILPSYVGILMNHYKDPGSLLNNQYNRNYVFSFRGSHDAHYKAPLTAILIMEYSKRIHIFTRGAYPRHSQTPHMKGIPKHNLLVGVCQGMLLQG